MLLAAAFLASQAFACCYANARWARSLASAFSPRSPAHACCAKTASAPRAEKRGCARECCLKAESQRAPQLASAPVDFPDLTGPAAPFVPAPPIANASPTGIVPVADTGPPVYLRTLRLLV